MKKKPINIPQKVLSIQSHVVHGYVGNRSAVFPLQLLGFDVSFINSVQFSNHTGYKNGVKGEVLSGKQLNELCEGMRSNNLLKGIQYLLTGYIGSKSFLDSVIQMLLELRESNSSLVYSCDPVLGDNGKLYVPEELVQVYIDKILPVADILTPNEFELSLLTNIEVTSFEDVLKGFERIHAKGVRKCIVTTTSFGDKALYASTITENGFKVYKASFPWYDDSFTGTGDLLSSLLLGWTALLGDNIELVLRNSLSSTQAVLKRTVDKYSEEEEQKELALIESRFDIMKPPQNDKIDIKLVKTIPKV